MVRSIKTALSAVLSKLRLTDEILVTAVTLVENVLYTVKKLTPVSEDPSDP